MRAKAFFKGTLREGCTFVERVAKKQGWSYSTDKSNSIMSTIYLSHPVNTNKFTFDSRDKLEIAIQEGLNSITVFDMSAPDEFWNSQVNNQDTNELSALLGHALLGTRWDGLKSIRDTVLAEIDSEGRRVELADSERNKASDEQAGAKPRKESKRKRIFGLRTEYLIAAIILGIIISVVSLFVFPDWARSNLTLVILFPFGFATATTIIANFRKAFE